MLLYSLFVNAALAGDGSVSDQVAALNALGHRPVLIATAGNEATRHANAALAKDPGLDAQVVTIPFAGDPDQEVQIALSKAGLACGLRVAGDGGKGWTLTTHGECGASAAPPAVASASPTAAAPTSAAAPAPGPTVSPPAPTFSTQDLWRIAEIQAASPAQGTSLALSATLGFGSGHFYAGRPIEGGVFAGTQLLGVLMGSGAYLLSDGGDGAVAVLGIGGTTLLVSRIVDMAMAPGSARKTSVAMMKARRKP